MLILCNADINECAEGTDRCAQNCHNNMGSYTCSCNVGFRLNANGYGCDGNYFKDHHSSHSFNKYFLIQILMSVLKAQIGVIKTATTMLDHTLVAVTLDTD